MRCLPFGVGPFLSTGSLALLLLWPSWVSAAEPSLERALAALLATQVEEAEELLEAIGGEHG